MSVCVWEGGCVGYGVGWTSGEALGTGARWQWCGGGGAVVDVRDETPGHRPAGRTFSCVSVTTCRRRRRRRRRTLDVDCTRTR